MREAEDALVAYLVWHPARVVDCEVSADWFADPACRTVFGAIVRLVIAEGAAFVGQADSYLAIAAALRASGEGGALDALAARGVLVEPADYDLRRLERAVQDAYERRSAALYAERLQVELGRGEPVRDAVGRTLLALDDLCAEQPERVTTYAAALAARAEAAAAPGHNAEIIPTGFPALDGTLGGLPRGGMTIVGARPSRGKSAFLQQLAEHVADAGGRVLLASPEMAAWEVGDRAVARATGIPLTKLRQRWLSLADRDALRTVAKTAPAAFARITVYDEPRQSSQQIAQLARRLRVMGPLDLIAVDYVQYLDEPRLSREQRYEVLGRAARLLKSAARQVGAALVMGAQLKREASGSAPTLADLRESGDLEQDADVVILLGEHAEPYQDGTCDVPVLIEKNRQGQRGNVTLRWRGVTTAFEGMLDDTRGAA